MAREGAYSYSSKTKSLNYIMDKLSQIDDGAYVDLDFISAEDVAKFCKLFGFKASWAGKAVEDICVSTKPDFGPKVVRIEEATTILGIVKTMVAQKRFKSRDGSPFDQTLLNDFIPKGRFQGKATLGHMWEWQFALQVELEHGRTHGTNVTNNHPLLTALIVMAHLAEDSLYYARLWAMETEGELARAVMEGKKKAEIADIAEELVRAKFYLGKRLAEKAGEEGVALPR